MSIDLLHKNLFDGLDEGVILTIDGTASGMEGNLARAFSRLYPDAWDEINYKLKYPVPLGTAIVIEINPDLKCHYKFFFLASTLNHLLVLTEQEKLNVLSNALRQVLAIGEARGIQSIGTAVLTGGWRLPIEVAFDQICKTYSIAKAVSSTTPKLNIYVRETNEYEHLNNYILRTAASEN